MEGEDASMFAAWCLQLSNERGYVVTRSEAVREAVRRAMGRQKYEEGRQDERNDVISWLCLGSRSDKGVREDIRAGHHVGATSLLERK